MANNVVKANRETSHLLLRMFQICKATYKLDALARVVHYTSIDKKNV